MATSEAILRGAGPRRATTSLRNFSRIGAPRHEACTVESFPGAQSGALDHGERSRSMTENLTAKTQVTIEAPPAKVWDALTKPELVKQYMMGADVKSDWKVGSPITYTGEYKGKRFEEKGVIKKIEPRKLLQATNFSTTSGKEDKPENYALVSWELQEKNGATVVTVSQDHIPSEKGVEGSKANWSAVLKGLKQTAEAAS
jgi:uncharacterized protein YndB with AHSA1/START domain